MEFVIMYLTIVNALLGYAVWKMSIELKAMRLSTHTVQMVDPFQSDEFQKVTEEIKDKLTKPQFDNVM